ncbi:MAG TPA: SCO1664 family protein [Acidimicrobiales bacterium]|nr:SCO1664 family protein [Acidimicrobiales bacterium]
MKDAALRVLAEGEIEVQGRMPWSSNNTFLVSVCRDGASLGAIYKPGRGERPLWDFPHGVYQREAAAWELSEILGWSVVPETLLRQDAPLGPGSLQRFVDADFSEHYFTLMENPTHHDQLRVIAVFDLLLNNADRKSGHCLLDADGRIWAIDNGLSFHVEPKLRTVIWDFAGEQVPEHLLADIERVAAGVPDRLAALLDDGEPEALVRRARAVLRHPQLPAPHPERRPYPWPLV